MLLLRVLGGGGGGGGGAGQGGGARLGGALHRGDEREGGSHEAPQLHLIRCLMVRNAGASVKPAQAASGALRSAEAPAWDGPGHVAPSSRHGVPRTFDDEPRQGELRLCLPSQINIRTV
jgi:hypothetical protein